MTCPLRPSLSAHEPWFRGIPPDAGRREQEALYSAADDPPSRCLQECWRSGWPILPNRHRNESRLVVAPPRQLIAFGQAKNRGPGELWLAALDCRRHNRWPCSTAGSLLEPPRCAGLESSARFVGGGQPYSESALCLRSAYPLRVSKRSRRRLPQAL